MARMVSPRLLVTLDDGIEYDIQTDNRDMVRFDLLKGRKQWPSMQEAPMLWVTVLAWSCLAREGKIPQDVGVEKGIDRIIAVEALDEDGNVVDLDDPAIAEAVSVDPTKMAS